MSGSIILMASLEESRSPRTAHFGVSRNGQIAVDSSQCCLGRRIRRVCTYHLVEQRNCVASLRPAYRATPAPSSMPGTSQCRCRSGAASGRVSVEVVDNRPGQLLDQSDDIRLRSELPIDGERPQRPPVGDRRRAALIRSVSLEIRASPSTTRFADSRLPTSARFRGLSLNMNDEAWIGLQAIDHRKLPDEPRCHAVYHGRRASLPRLLNGSTAMTGRSSGLGGLAIRLASRLPDADRPRAGEHGLPRPAGRRSEQQRMRQVHTAKAAIAGCRRRADRARANASAFA